MDTKCEMEKVILGKNNIKNYKLYDNRRRIRPAQVSKLKNLLVKGEHFDTPLAVNMRDNVLWILDGNHRYEALVKYFEENPQQQVTIWQMVYKLETKEDEKKKFLELNSGVKPTGEDFIQQYADDIPFLKNFLETSDKVSIYGTIRKPIKIRRLLHIYHYIKLKRNLYPAQSALDIINKAKDYTKVDAIIINAFLIDFEEAFGKIIKENKMIRHTIIASVFRLWYLNHKKINYEHMIKRMRRLMNHPYTQEYGRMGGREAIQIAAQKFKQVMDKGYKNKLILEVEENE